MSADGWRAVGVPNELPAEPNEFWLDEGIGAKLVGPEFAGVELAENERAGGELATGELGADGLVGCELENPLETNPLAWSLSWGAFSPN